MSTEQAQRDETTAIEIVALYCDERRRGPSAAQTQLEDRITQALAEARREGLAEGRRSLAARVAELEAAVRLARMTMKRQEVPADEWEHVLWVLYRALAGSGREGGM